MVTFTNHNSLYCTRLQYFFCTFPRHTNYNQLTECTTSTDEYLYNHGFFFSLPSQTLQRMYHQYNGHTILVRCKTSEIIVVMFWSSPSSQCSCYCSCIRRLDCASSIDSLLKWCSCPLLHRFTPYIQE